MDEPAQPLLARYPTKMQASSQRAFHSDWFSHYEWLEYSQQQDAAFCFVCRHFPAPSANADVAFTTTVSRTIIDLLTEERARQIRDNRMYLSAVVDVLKFTAIHRLAQRGHDESDGSLNCGNFLDFLHVVGKYNETVGQKLVNLPANAKYTSKDTQNEILTVMASMVRGTIVDEVKE